MEAALVAATTELEARVALLTRMGTDGLAVDPHVSGSEVTLTGEVRRPRDLIIAGQVASSLPGITTVHNELSVASGRPEGTHTANGELTVEVGDELLAARVKFRLYTKLGLEAARVEVAARGGSVTLSGVLPTRRLRTIAVTTAETSRGCVEVIDEIDVPRGESP